jgi:hypothetical protein
VKFALISWKFRLLFSKNLNLNTNLFDADMSLLILLKIKRHIIKIGSNMLNKLVLRTLLSISLAFGALGAANATLISQDILLNSDLDNVDEYQVIGNITISLDNMDVDAGFGYVYDTWESFTFYGYEADPFDANWNLFTAIVDVDNIAAGIEALDFDVTLFSTLSFAGFIDAFDPAGSINYSFFNNADASLIDTGALAFGNATVVPAPATLVLFLTAVVALTSRRKHS